MGLTMCTWGELAFRVSSAAFKSGVLDADIYGALVLNVVVSSLNVE
jgi:hypothetical protein